MPSIDFGGRARGVALFAFLGFAVAGCAGSSSDTDPSALSRQMFEAGFEDIEQVYIDKPDIGTLALAGMQQLSTIDSDVTARRTGDKVELLLKNQIAYSQDRRRRLSTPRIGAT